MFRKGQKIQIIALILGLLGHNNKLVEWMIGERKHNGFFDISFETEIFAKQITLNLMKNSKKE